MESGSHQFADEGIAFAFDQQLSDATFQRLGFILASLIALGDSRGHVGNVVENALGEGNGHTLAGYLIGHGS